MHTWKSGFGRLLGLRGGLGLGLGLSAALPAIRTAHCKSAGAPTEGEGDVHLWLEEVEGQAQLQWCVEQNKRLGDILGNIEDHDSYKKILAIADSKDKIPHVSRIGGKTGDDDAKLYYNFWQDAEHRRGVWRRTSLASYKTASPEWETGGCSHVHSRLPCERSRDLSIAAVACCHRPLPSPAAVARCALTARFPALLRSSPPCMV